MSSKNKIIYFGLDPTDFIYEGELTHHPLIRICPRSVCLDQAKSCSHILFTSKSCVSLFFDQVAAELLTQKTVLAVGKKTAEAIKKRGIKEVLFAKKECQEGVIEMMEFLNLQKAHLFFPHSSLSRPLLVEYLTKKNICFTEVILYDIEINKVQIPNLNSFDEFVFTSPSTVEAFHTLFGPLPRGKKLKAIGPVTQKAIEKYQKTS